MDARQRDIFARYLLDLLHLSQCSSPRAAIVVRGTSVIGSGVSKKIVPEKDHENCPVMTAVMEYCGHGSEKEDAPILFSSYFPSYYEFLLLLLTHIRTVYYLGDIHDERTVALLNAHTASSPVDGFEIIGLKI